MNGRANWRASARLGILMWFAPAALAAQIVSGTVVDSASKRPLAGVTVVVRTAKDATLLRGAVTDSVGRFALLLPKPDTVMITVRRIGFQQLTTPARWIASDSVRTYSFEMAQVPFQLDTVRSQGTKYITGRFYKLTAGQEYFAQHFRAGKGFFTSGTEIALSGMDACEYLGRVPGFGIASVIVRDGFGIACYEGNGGSPARYIVPIKGGCVEPYVDRKHQLIGVSPTHFLVGIPGFSKPKWVPIEGIRGIEVFGKYEDRPKDLSYQPPPQDPPADPFGTMGAFDPLNANRPGGLLGSAPRTNRAAATLASAGRQRCSLMLLWTAQYWGD